MGEIAIISTYLLMLASLVVMVPAAALGTPTQQQFQNYQSPTLGVSIQYPSDWKLLEESNDKLRFIKQEGFVIADLNVENLDQSDAKLPEYANTRVNELRAQRLGFQLLSSEPTIISNDIPSQKVVYTFDREEDGKTNKVMRIWSINEGKLYTLAYIAESSQYDRYLPSFQRMVDSFRIDNTGSTTQVQSDDRSRDNNNGGGNCDRISYPDPNVCIPPYPPDLNCPDIPYKNFRVIGNDPHGFDRDNDGFGCDSANGAPPPPRPPPGNSNGECIEDHGYLLSKGSYIDTGNNAIVGSPCDPVEFCSDPDSTDPVVIDHCEDIWTDDDDKEELPICDSAEAKPGEPCRDEGDPDDCEPGFVDRGFGCEPEVCVDIFPSICFPDHPSNMNRQNSFEEMIDENDTPPEEVEEEEEKEEESSDEEEESEQSEQEEESSQEEAEAIP